MFAISGALRYRSGRHPELGRHRASTLLPRWQRNAIFMALPVGLGLICGAVLIGLGGDAPVAAVAPVSLLAITSLVSAFVFAYRPPRWLLPLEERIRADQP